MAHRLAIIALNIAFTSVVAIDLLLTKSDVIYPHFGWMYAYSTLGSLSDVILYGYSISYIAGFIIAWISTIVLLVSSLCIGKERHIGLL